ncbi:MAG: glycosylase [Rikenellaceae bacterium]|jgi:predicted GH43/DUF377 family glycosyl hydrolase|nr:glycosylase [Rikenellaceae bacterium]
MILIPLLLILLFTQPAKDVPTVVPESVMFRIYNEVKTPYKYGLVMTGADATLRTDCPTIFRRDGKWYMYYFIFDGRGYETWMAESANLLDWTTTGRVLSFSDDADWDANQKGGYLALVDYQWGGGYALNKHDDKYWITYFGGSSKGYEAGLLSIGAAYTTADPTRPHEWQRLDRPVMMSTDPDARWWENITMYKNSVIADPKERLGYPYVMYFNAKGDSISKVRGAERIGMAVSNDMVNWERYLDDPVLEHGPVGITGDAYIQKMGNVWVMFYFGAFWQDRPGMSAWNRFACSYDLVSWTDWTGADLINPTEEFDARFAHKSCVIKWKGVVYHFYCSVDEQDRRGIAVATSKDFGKSKMVYPEK